MDSFLDASAAADSAPEGAGPPMTAAEYSESVYQWLVQAHQWHTFVAGISIYLLTYMRVFCHAVSRWRHLAHMNMTYR